MPLNKIKTGSITDDAVNSDKIAANSVTNTELDKTVITGQTELSETANDADFAIIFDASANALRKVLRSNLKQAAPVVSSISPTTTDGSTTNATFTVTGTGFTVGSSARFIGNDGTIVEFDTITRSSATSITAVVAQSKLELGKSPYDIQVTNGEGIATVLQNQVNHNQVPAFVTAAGSLGTVLNGNRSGLRFVINANDPDSAANVTYELQSGSLPAGLALTTEGSEGGIAVISGNATAVGSNTTSNFVIRAVDNASNTSSRSFSITINAPQSTSFTSDGTFAVPSGVTAVDVLVVAGGGAGAGNTPNGGGGGAGGLIFQPNAPVTPGGTVAVTVGAGGPNNRGEGSTGSDSVFGASPSPGTTNTLTAKGGGKGGGWCGQGHAGGQGGSGGGGSGQAQNSGSGQATQPTQPGNSGAYGFGHDGGTRNSCAGNGGGGGGGAGAAGAPGQFTSGQPSYGGNGGIGKAYTIADGTTSVYYAGGGGGNGPNGSNPGGQGGGGTGHPAYHGQPGTANTGGGGGAGEDPGGFGGSGGKGIVIVRF
jgi:hypothetical protein